MKQGWEIKKLGEVCKIQTGKLDANAKVDDGEYPFFTCDAKPYRINTYAFDDEAILISGNGSLVGHINYYNGKFNAYQRTYVLTQFTSFHLPFLISYLKGFLRSYIIENKKGGCIPYITLPILRNFTIPCPSLAEQEKIVVELDCLSGVIEKKREQLKELDALAQSIFYQMFGDPITNEKGWEVKRLKDVCSDIIDGDHNPPPKSDNGIPFITISNINKDTKTIELANTYYVTEEYYNSIKPNKKPKKGDVLYTVTGSYGLPVLIKEDIRFCFQRHIGLLRPTDVINSVYLYIWAMLPQTKCQADDIATGIAQKTVSLSGLKQMSIILPPLTLQHEFADKIEAIEKQKELIKQSIAETETLFNARMNYYFN